MGIFLIMQASFAYFLHLNFLSKQDERIFQCK